MGVAGIGVSVGGIAVLVGVAGIGVSVGGIVVLVGGAGVDVGSSSISVSSVELGPGSCVEQDNSNPIINNEPIMVRKLFSLHIAASLGPLYFNQWTGNITPTLTLERPKHTDFHCRADLS